MKIFKGMYGWSTSAHSKTREGDKITCYLECQFKKGEEPITEELEGTLVFRGSDGIERDCFFSSYQKQGASVPKMVLMKKKFEQTRLSDGSRDILGKNVEIDTEELPFY